MLHGVHDHARLVRLRDLPPHGRATLVVFLDAYIDRAPGAPGTGLTADDVDRADWILVGHSHFDHLWGAERIARNTGATIVGSYETVRVMAEQGVPLGAAPAGGGRRAGAPVRRRDGERVPVAALVRVDEVGGMFAADAVCLGDLGVTHQERSARFADMRGLMAGTLDAGALAHLAESQQDARGDGGALVFLIETPDGSLLYQDTSGHWTGILHDLRPDVAILAAAGRGNVDGEPVQGSLADFVGATGVARPRTRGGPLAPRRLAAGVLDCDRRRDGARGGGPPLAAAPRSSSSTTSTATGCSAEPLRRLVCKDCRGTCIDRVREPSGSVRG